MKNIMIALLVLCFTATVGNTNETKTIHLNKVTTNISNENQDINEYQKDNWEKGKVQTANNIGND